MKKLILGIMLVMGTLSFANHQDGDRAGSNLGNLKSKAEVIYNKEQSPLQMNDSLFSREHNSGHNRERN